MTKADLINIVAKRLDSAYRPARRSPSWLKVKNRNGQELVIGGWVPGAGGRAGRIGALLVGHHDVEPEAAARRGRPQRLRYAGRVGSGLAEADLDRLAAALEGLRRADSPFDGGRPPRDAVFVEPRLVCEVEFTEWTRSGTLRHPVFGGIRDDKDPADVVREPAASDRPPGDESRPMG